MQTDRYLDRRGMTVDVTGISYEQVRPFFKWVYAWMGVGLLVSTVIAVLTMTIPELFALTTNRGVVIGAFIAQFALVIGLGFGIQRMSPTLAGILFIGYAGLLGFTLSLVLMAYTATSVVGAFVTATALFLIMTAFAFTTTVDLTKFGSYFMMALIGLFVAMIVNVFVGSGPLSLMISFVGVILFTGLIAYDTQVLKGMAVAHEVQNDASIAARYSILGALRLYLDFVNLFLFLLRLTAGGGGRR